MVPRPVAGLLAAAFLALVALELHGYSLPVWHELVDGSPAPEVLVGEPRTIRGDEYLVFLPLALAQRAHEPPFPVVNTTIGEGQSMLVPFSVPVAHPLALFRPTTWGFFLGDDVGLAWRWWTRVFGLLLAGLAVFGWVGGGRRDLAWLAAATLVLAPMLQLWSLQRATVVVFGGLSFASGLWLALTPDPRRILPAGACLGWSLACFALTLYPPAQIVVALVLGAVGAALLFERRESLRTQGHVGRRVAALALAVAVVIGAVALLVGSAGDAIAALRDTSYPGQRVSTGGERLLAELVATNLLLPLRVDDWGSLLNVSEAAGFFLLSPVLLLATRWRVSREGGRRGPTPVEWAAGLGVLVCGWHAVVGIPAAIAQATPLGFVPGRRAFLGLGLAELVLVVRWLSLARPSPRAPSVGLSLLAAVLLAGAAWQLAGAVPEATLALGGLLAAVNGGVVWLALRRPSAAVVLGSALAVSAACSLGFNPLVRGGSDFVRENPLARAVLRIDAEHGGDTRWITWGGSPAAQLFRMLGVESIDGVHPVPQDGLWRAIDPAGRQRGITHRFAYVVFGPGASRRPELRMPEPTTVAVSLRPDSPLLATLGVTHVAVPQERAERFERVTGAARLETAGHFVLFALAPSAEP